MNEDNLSSSVKHSYAKRNQSRKFVRIVIVLFIATYVVLGTSKLYLPTKSTWIDTPLNTQASIGKDRTIKLIRWDYSPSQNYIEIEVDIANESTEKGFYQCNVNYMKDKKEISLPVCIIYQNATNAIIHVKDVPSTANQFSFIFAFMRKSDDYDATLMNASISSMKQVENLTPLNEAGYQLKRKQLEKIATDAKIKKSQSKINKRNEEISVLQKQIESLNAEAEYKTSDELIDLNADITKKTTEIDKLSAAIQSENLKITDYTTKITELDNLIKTLEPNVKEIKIKYE